MSEAAQTVSACLCGPCGSWNPQGKAERDSININLKVSGTYKESSQYTLGVKINYKRAASKHWGDTENRVQTIHEHSAAQNAVVTLPLMIPLLKLLWRLKVPPTLQAYPCHRNLHRLFPLPELLFPRWLIPLAPAFLFLDVTFSMKVSHATQFKISVCPLPPNTLNSFYPALYFPFFQGTQHPPACFT